jgi:hypothetical protein
MILATAVLWVGLPVGWLWVGSQVQGETDSLGMALLVMAAGFAVSVFAVMRLLGWLNLQYVHARERRGLEGYGNVTLEALMSISAGLALVSFCIWFFLFSGSSPVPLNIGY